MNNRLLIPAALGAIATAATVAASGGAQISGERTITVFEDVAHESSALVDNAPRSPSRNPDSRRFRLSAGDEHVARTPLLDGKGGARLGTSYAHAVVVGGKRFTSARLQADVILTLRDGTIALTGVAGAAQQPFAVIGGTGAYAGARGTATERETEGGADLEIRLLP